MHFRDKGDNHSVFGLTEDEVRSFLKNLQIHMSRWDYANGKNKVMPLLLGKRGDQEKPR